MQIRSAPQLMPPIKHFEWVTYIFLPTQRPSCLSIQILDILMRSPRDHVDMGIVEIIAALSGQSAGDRRTGSNSSPPTAARQVGTASLSLDAVPRRVYELGYPCKGYDVISARQRLLSVKYSKIKKE